MAYAIALIHEENGAFGVSFPDFPGCVSTGSSLDDAIVRGGQALALHIAGMRQDGEPLPRLRSARELRFDPAIAEELDGATVATVRLELP
jgi:predicted RNase H-like HicB family nuclease